MDRLRGDTGGWGREGRSQSRVGWLLLAAALAMATAGCRSKAWYIRPRSVKEVSSFYEERRLSAVSDIEGVAARRRDLPPEAMDALLQQYPKERHFETKCHILGALAATGKPEAQPLLVAFAQTENPVQQRCASRAWKLWTITTQNLPSNHKLPRGWPYGTEGFPDWRGD